jgi:energy-coupling factor transporter ATP-binding protein EcfA2
MYYGGDENTGESDFKLRNINLEFAIGKLNLIAGSTGAGKSSLLLALLGGFYF